MGTPKSSEPSLLITGLLSAFEEALAETEKTLTAAYGPIALKSPLFDFTATDYYETDMGKGLKRLFLAFEKPIDPAAIADIKLATNKMEARIAESGRWPAARPVNVDSGYLTLSKLVLATTKDYSHRLYLGKGIYAESTLHYEKGKWQPWPWTYRDYRENAGYYEFFEKARETILTSLRKSYTIQE